MNRSGFALVFVLLIIAAVELLTISSLALATHEAVVADAHMRTVVAARDADVALASLIKAWPIPAFDSLRIGEKMMMPASVKVSVEVVRISWGTYHLTAMASADEIAVRRAAILRKLDIGRAMAESAEAIVAAGHVFASQAAFGVDPEMRCTVPVVEGPDDAIFPGHYAFGGINWDEIASIADIHASGTIQLIPADTTGAPLYPLIYAEGDLTISSGAGHGLIFVDGNLQIQNRAQFSGLIIVRGTITIADDVEIDGTLHVQGSGTSHIGRARISYSRCAIVTALLETPAAARLIRARRTFLPAF